MSPELSSKAAADAVKHDTGVSSMMFGEDGGMSEGEIDQLVDVVLMYYEIFGDKAPVADFLETHAEMGAVMNGVEMPGREEIESLASAVIDRYDAYMDGEVDEHPAAESTGQDNILDTANSTVGQRADEYGPPTENFRAIAEMWSGYLGIEITPYDYSQMMQLAKIGRTKTGSPDRDTHVDQAGYALCTDLVWNDGSEPAPYQNR